MRRLGRSPLPAMANDVREIPAINASSAPKVPHAVATVTAVAAAEDTAGDNFSAWAAVKNGASDAASAVGTAHFLTHGDDAGIPREGEEHHGGRGEDAPQGIGIGATCLNCVVGTSIRKRHGQPQTTPPRSALRGVGL